MKRVCASLAVLLGAFLFSSQARGEEASGSCVACHSGIQHSGALEHGFLDWQGSIHGRSGIECQACHGGDASRTRKEDAHRGVLSSRDPESRIYFTRIPETCGSCHSSELRAFQKSAHRKELGRGGRAPNCVTCHGSMADHVLSSKDMEMTCALCHRQPTQAHAARRELEDARAGLRRLEKEIRQAREAGGTNLSESEKIYARLTDRLQEAVDVWHTFQMSRVIAQAEKISREASAAYTELRLKRRKP